MHNAQQQQPDLDLAVRMMARLVEGHTLGAMLGFSEESQEALYALGHCLYGQARYEDALRVFGFLLTHNHLERRYYLAFGACLQMLSRLEDALKYYGMASFMDMTDPEPVFHAAHCLLALGRRKEAGEALEYAQCMARGVAPHAELSERISALLDLLARGRSDPAGAPAPAEPAEVKTTHGA